MAAQAARFCLRAIQNERVFLQLEQAKVEQGKLYRAAQELGAALSEKDVVEAGVKAARRSPVSTSRRSPSATTRRARTSGRSQEQQR